MPIIPAIVGIAEAVGGAVAGAVGAVGSALGAVGAAAGVTGAGVTAGTSIAAGALIVGSKPDYVDMSGIYVKMGYRSLENQFVKDL